MSSCPPGGSWRARNPGPCCGRPRCPSRTPPGRGCGCTRCTAIRASRRFCWRSSIEARARAARGMSRNSRSTAACSMSTGWIRPGCWPTAGPGRWILTTTHPSSRASSPRTRCTSPDSRSAAELSSPPASSTARSACCQRRPGSGSYRRTPGGRTGTGRLHGRGQQLRQRGPAVGGPALVGRPVRGDTGRGRFRRVPAARPAAAAHAGGGRGRGRRDLGHVRRVLADTTRGRADHGQRDRGVHPRRPALDAVA